MDPVSFGDETGRYRNAIGNNVDQSVPCESRGVRLLGNRRQDNTRRIMTEERSEEQTRRHVDHDEKQQVSGCALPCLSEDL